MVIIGLGGLTKDILSDLLLQYSKNELLFFTDIENDNSIDFFIKAGLQVSSKSMDLANHFEKDNRFLILVGHNKARSELVEKYRILGGQPHHFISNSANINRELCSLSTVNTVIMNEAQISAGAVVEEGAIVSQYAYVGHDATLGKYAFMAGYSGISNGHIGDYSFIGLKSVVLPGRSIGKNATIGAYSMVNKSIPDNAKAFGIPAKVS